MAFPPYISDTTDENDTVYTMTSRGEVERQLSYYGVALHLDDLDPNDDNYNEDNDADANMDNFLEEQIQMATSEIMSVLGPRYLVEDIYKNPQLRRIATFKVAHAITRRRGNEPVFEEEVIIGEEKLLGFQAGTLYLDAPSNGQRAIIQSGVVDMRYTRQPWRIIQSASSSTVSGQNIGRQAFFWL